MTKNSSLPEITFQFHGHSPKHLSGDICVKRLVLLIKVAGEIIGNEGCTH